MFSFIANSVLAICCFIGNIAHRCHRYTHQDLSTSEYTHVLFTHIATCDHDNHFHSHPLSASSDSRLPACVLGMCSLRLHWDTSCWFPHFRRPPLSLPYLVTWCHLTCTLFSRTVLELWRWGRRLPGFTSSYVSKSYMYKILKICDYFAWNYIRSFIQSSNTISKSGLQCFIWMPNYWNGEKNRERRQRNMSVFKKKACEKRIKPTAITGATTSKKGVYFHNDFRGIWLYFLCIIRQHMKGEHCFCILQRLRKGLI